MNREIKFRKYTGEKKTIIKPIMLKSGHEKENHVTVEIKGKDQKEIDRITETVKRAILNEDRHVENGVSFTIYRQIKN